MFYGIQYIILLIFENDDGNSNVISAKFRESQAKLEKV